MEKEGEEGMEEGREVEEKEGMVEGEENLKRLLVFSKKSAISQYRRKLLLLQLFLELF